MRAVVLAVMSACGFAPAPYGTGDDGTTVDAALADARDHDGQMQQVQGSLAVTRQVVTGPFDVTTEGTLDWVVWGPTSVTEVERKANGGTKIASWTEVGSGTVYGYGNAYHQPGNDGFTWSDGTPMVMQSTAQYCGVWIDYAPNGFATTVEASTTPRVLRMYVGGADATGTFTASLSDDSATAYTDANGIGTTGASWAGVYEVHFNAATAGATLHVQWVQSSTGGGDVNWSAATLH